MTEYPFVPLDTHREYPADEMRERSRALLQELRRRRTVRHFSSRSVPSEVIENCLLAAGTAPSGANRQPWHFTVISDPDVRRRIRIAAEKEEKEFYEKRAPKEWLEALAPLGTDDRKPFLENAPCLIAIFGVKFEELEGGVKSQNYYVQESVGIATGLLITAIHHAGLVSLTHTPSPMRFLNEVLGRPASEKPFLLLVVGYPDDEATVPEIGKKSLDEIASFI